MRMVVECYFSHLAPILGLTSWKLYVFNDVN